MADVQPFCAVRYANPSASVIAPPYDVISPEEREAFLRRDPHNVVHLTLAEDEALAGDIYRDWLETGVLVREEDPAVWVWEQDFIGVDGAPRRRNGIVASLHVEPYGHGVVPHERTHPAPIESRLRLLRAVHTQLEPLFFLHDGPSPLRPPERPPDIEAEETRVWRIDANGDVRGFFAERDVLIADGHHRYETSLAFAAESGDPADARVLAVLVSTEDPGLEILAAHRVFTGRPDLVAAGKTCSSIDEALARLAAAANDRSAAVFYGGGGGASLVTGEEGELDVELVDRAGLEGISYTIDWQEAVAQVDAGAADCAYLVRPTRIDDVFERARRGEVMPPKATHFFPKLTSGLLFHPLARG